MPRLEAWRHERVQQFVTTEFALECRARAETPRSSAGWAVDDQAAKEFAQPFYTEMLAGQEFGQAVLAARRVRIARR